jgi:excisionase family DNA binding protein
MVRLANHMGASSANPSDSTGPKIIQALAELLAVQREILDLLTGRSKSHYTVEEISELVGRSPFTVRRWITAGRLHAVRIEGTGPRGRLLIPRDQLDALVSAGLGASIPAVAVDDQ